MATIYQFPSKDERQWPSLFEAISELLLHLGATRTELDQLQSRLRERWESLGRPFDIQPQFHLVGPLTEAQLDSIKAAMQAQAAEIADRLKAEHAATLIEFAKLEFELLRFKRIDNS